MPTLQRLSFELEQSLSSHLDEHTLTPMSAPKIAYSFLRWSTKIQGKDSTDSKTRQMRSTREWCDRNGYTLSNEVFIGAGESGYSGKHLKVDKETGRAVGALAKFH